MSSEPSPLNGSRCQAPGCDRPMRVRDFCVACYYRQLRRGDIVAGTASRRWKHRLSDVNEETQTATCAACGPVKIRRRSSDQWRCGSDSDKRSKLYKEAYRASKRAMLVGACEICGAAEDLCWDHDHDTSRFRGTLCGRCNSAVGLMDDDAERLRAAAAYLERAGSRAKKPGRGPHRVRSKAALRTGAEVARARRRKLQSTTT